MYSYHIFYFPFKWENPGNSSELFSEQTDLNRIKIDPYSGWIRNPEITDDREADELYNEKNYYYPFVHPVLYDDNKPDSIMHHYERKETRFQDNASSVVYVISMKGGKTYRLKVDALNLNFYATGVGMLTFFLENDREDQKNLEDILNINQHGRRIFPPFIADVKDRNEIAGYIAIEGLNGDPNSYKEDFSNYVSRKEKNDTQHQSSWESASFIRNLIRDLSPELSISPVIDDRMFVNCWYPDNDLSRGMKNMPELFMKKDGYWWYRYVFIDKGWPTCQNDKMISEFIENATYARWQKYGTMYGVSRYSFVSLTDSDSWESRNLIAVHMRTVYSRMVELVLIQRASILKFSSEVTEVSRLSKSDTNDSIVVDKISSLYKEYIRFVNQIYFREVSAQDQGIELYELMSRTLKIKEHVEDLDNEIEELHQYVSFLEDKEQNRKAGTLNLIAAIFLPATLFAGIFGMNSISDESICCTFSKPQFWIQIGMVVVATIVMYWGIKRINKKRR